jgi:sugar phosphate isomerase/epimerase
MKLAFATLGCPSWTLERMADEARRMGYDGVELRGVSGEHIGADEPVERRLAVRRLFESQGIAIAAVMGYTAFTGNDPESRRQAVEGAAAMIRLCADLGSPILRVFGGRRSDGLARRAAVARVVESLTRLTAFAERWGVTVAVETHDDWCRGEWLREVIEGVGHSRIGVCWDIANTWFEEPSEQTWEALRPYVWHVHIKDARREADGRIRNVLPGEGQVDLGRALRLLTAAGYSGYLSFEWEKKWHPELADAEIAFPHTIRYLRSLLSAKGDPS